MLPRLPTPPALRWSAFLVRTTRELSLPDLMSWAAKMWSRRHYVPIGLVRNVTPDEEALFKALWRTGRGFAPIIAPRRLARGAVTEKEISRLRGNALEGLILALWRREWKVHDRNLLPLLRTIIAHGVRGGLAYSLKATGMDGAPVSESTVRRRLKDADLPTLAMLLRDARLRGALLRMRLGATKRDAAIAAGFTSIKGLENAVRRSR